MNYTFKNPKEMGIYVQTSNYKTITQLQRSLGVDVICNFQMFTIATKEANYILKVNGELVGWDGENYWGIGWNKGDKTFTYDYAQNVHKYENFAGCVPILRDGKIVDHVPGVTYPSAIGGRRGHTVIGTKPDGSIVIHCWKDGSKEACRIEDLGQKMLDLGCNNAINFDGGGSTQLICPDGKVLTSRTIYNFFYAKLDKIESNNDNDKEDIVEDCPYTEPTVNVKFGSIGNNAKWVQWYLNKCGAQPQLKVDGIFGIGSQSALISFQKKAGLDVDGVCGPATRVALRTYSNNTNSTIPSVKPSTGSGCPYKEPTTNIKNGMVGEGVKWLQWYLNYHGANPKLTVDGDFGPATLRMLTAFQKTAKIEVDGICGRGTRAALKGERLTTLSATAAIDPAYKKSLIEKREKMLDIIESCPGNLYVYGGQGQEINNSNVVNWSANCFPQYTTATRADRMKKYAKDHPTVNGKPIMGMDCSGTFWYAENIVELPLADGFDVDDATAAGLYNQYCYPISKSELQPLDLVFNNDLTHVAIVVRNGKVVEAMGSDIGVVLNDNVNDRTAKSVFGTKYGTYDTYQGSQWTKFGRLKIYQDIPYEK